MTILRGYWKSLLVALIILYASLLREPHFTLPPIDHGDKWAHLLAYAIFGAMMCWDSTRYGLTGWRKLLVVILLPVLYGGALEVMQEWWFYPRTGDWWDWMADSIGVGLGASIASAIIALTTRKV